jgi:hypothetical protein
MAGIAILELIIPLDSDTYIVTEPESAASRANIRVSFAKIRCSYPIFLLDRPATITTSGHQMPFLAGTDGVWHG